MPQRKLNDLDGGYEAIFMKTYGRWISHLDNSSVVKIIESQQGGKRFVINQKSISATP